MPPHWRKRYEKLDQPDPPGWVLLVMAIAAILAVLVGTQVFGCRSSKPICPSDYPYLVPGSDGLWKECDPSPAPRSPREAPERAGPPAASRLPESPPA